MLQSPFDLIRHGIQYATFRDSETRSKIIDLLDEIEEEINNNPLGFDLMASDTVAECTTNLQEHIIDLLTLEDASEESSSNNNSTPKMVKLPADLEEGNENED